MARDQILVTHAAREAARAAAVDADPAAARRAARATPGPSSADRLDVDGRERGAVGGRVTGRRPLPGADRVPLVGPLLDDVVLDAAATMRVER